MAVLDLDGSHVVLWELVAQPAANFSPSLFSDHDCLSFHQLTVPEVKPGFALQRQLSR